ncbi:5'-nucleotidase [Pseudoalteromonas marina]|uniref:5'-nucleotidase n=1 Tax=Pseudoalteromonas marina TaxID=267375 RepID=A0ABT9FBY5_9GAMM|nr:5'-nucleotidase [Pseudoalteromonas marina]MDP2564301.1 5'-nucleotidase [Pseudoalteromonas marina]
MIIKSKLILTISSRALFNLSESHEKFLKSKKEFEKYQTENEDVVLEKGNAFEFIRKLLDLNNTKSFITGKEIDAVEVILISQNSMQTGKQIIKSIKHYGLGIERFVFTCGDNPAEYLINDDIKTHLYIGHNRDVVDFAIENGIPAALIMSKPIKTSEKEIRLAFDGDAVLFSDESEKVFQSQGLEGFIKNEELKAKTPLEDGPLKPLFMAIGDLRNHFPDIIKIGLVTARSGAGITRVIYSFDHWGMHPDHASFLGGISKRYFLKAFQTDLFFDDHPTHCRAAKDFVATCHIPNGIANNNKKLREH